MVAFYGEPLLKEKTLSRMREHRRLDRLAQGAYYDGYRGCVCG